MASCKKNDTALSYLYDHYAGTLLTCITRMVRDRNTAADVLPYVFIKVYLNIPSYDAGKGRLLTGTCAYPFK
jgi:DNA-directed RNA polymerase specialized sigma24 family protein